MTFFIQLLGEVIHYSRPFPGRTTSVEILINPRAGSLYNKRRLKKQIEILEQWKRWNLAGLEANSDINVRLHMTESMDHAQSRAVQLVENLIEDRWAEKKILLLAGGDGFHKDVCTAIMQKDPALLNSIFLFRLPLGTGNDASDCDSLSEACKILFGPVKEIQKSCLSIKPSCKKEDFCFNIASVGLDAYVCELTEFWKGRLPGNVYKIMVDLSVLLYDRKYPIAPGRIELIKNGQTEQVEGSFLLTIMGSRGNSTYGGKIRILPNENNVLLTENVSLLKRIILKGHFLKGSHGKFPINRFFDADRMILHYPEDVLMQLDGEVVPLMQENFPLEITRLYGRIRTFSSE